MNVGQKQDSSEYRDPPSPLNSRTLVLNIPNILSLPMK